LDEPWAAPGAIDLARSTAKVGGKLLIAAAVAYDVYDVAAAPRQQDPPECRQALSPAVPDRHGGAAGGLHPVRAGAGVDPGSSPRAGQALRDAGSSPDGREMLRALDALAELLWAGGGKSPTRDDLG
jgi:hypothetical protein